MDEDIEIGLPVTNIVKGKYTEKILTLRYDEEI